MRDSWMELRLIEECLPFLYWLKAAPCFDVIATCSGIQVVPVGLEMELFNIALNCSCHFGVPDRFRMAMEL